MSNHVRNQLSCCYMKKLDFRAPSYKSTKLAIIEGRIQTLYFLWYLNVGVSTVLLQCLHVIPFIIHSNLRDSRRTLKNLHIQEMRCLPSFFFGDRCRVRNLLTLVIWDVFRIPSTIHPPLFSLPLKYLFKGGTLSIG